MSAELFEAIESHQLDRLRAVLSGGADPNAVRRDWPRWLALHAAIDELEQGASIDAVVLLLRHGANPNGLDPSRDAPPLLMALFRHQPEAARMLLAVGADPNVVGDEGDSPLRWCVERGDLEMAATLLRCGAAKTIDGAGGPSGMTALGRAASQLNIAMLKFLLQAGADPKALDADRLTAFERLPSRSSAEPEAWDIAAALLGQGSSAPG
jgi:ankyrin repeat protein